MSATATTAYQLGFTGRIAPARSCKMAGNKDFYGYRSTFTGEAHCIKDRVLLDSACGIGDF